MWYTPWIEVIRSSLAGAVSSPADGSGGAAADSGWLGRGPAGSSVGFCGNFTSAERIESTAAIRSAIAASGAVTLAPVLVGMLVFWVIFLGFAAAAVEMAGLPVVTELIGRLAAYVPSLIAAAALLLVGIVIARSAKTAVTRAARNARITQSSALGSVVYGLIVVIAIVVALEQLGVNGRVLELTIAVTVGSALAAVALAFGFGAQGSVANMIAARYAAKLCRVGQSIRIDGVEGIVMEIVPTAVILETMDGTVAVPAVKFQESTVVLPRGRPEMDATLLLAIRFAIDHPLAAARRLETVESTKCGHLLSQLTPGQGAAVLCHMAPAKAAKVLASVDRDQWVNPSYPCFRPDRRSQFSRRWTEVNRARVLESLAAGVAGRISRLLRYPEGSVGAIMDPPSLRAVGYEGEDVCERASDHRLPYVYLVDVSSVWGAWSTAKISRLQRRRGSGVIDRHHQVVRVPAGAPAAAVRGHESWREFEALPVVDGGESLRGSAPPQGPSRGS